MTKKGIRRRARGHQAQLQAARKWNGDLIDGREWLARESVDSMVERMPRDVRRQYLRDMRRADRKYQ